MKHSESVKIYQVQISRYHGNVKAVLSMIVLLTESVEISGTALPAKSDSDVMLVYKVSRDL